jgi:hypothetical protein
MSLPRQISFSHAPCGDHDSPMRHLTSASGENEIAWWGEWTFAAGGFSLIYDGKCRHSSAGRAADL